MDGTTMTGAPRATRPQAPQRVAVIGGGVAGLGAAWLLARRHKVTLFERNGYVGGHANTVEAPDGRGGTIPVDTGFIVYNERTYPNLIGLFDRLGLAHQPSEMSFAVACDAGRLEYGGGSLPALFAQRRNLVSPRFVGMVRDILRFYREAPDALALGQCAGVTLGEYLAAGGYSRAFADDHLLPMAAAIWSCPVATMAEFPAESFIRFCDNHGLLQVADRPRWFTVPGGSRAYVRRMTDALPDVRAGAPVVSVRREASGVRVRTADGTESVFDTVVFGCHPDEALAMIDAPSPAERDLLGAFRYQRNRAVLHTDTAQMPRRRKVWSSWNYLADRDRDAERRVAVTYWMNNLQSLDAAHDLFVTLNPFKPVDPAHVLMETDYDHPVFDTAAVAAQQALPAIQGADRLWFCGAYCGYGFHEDGLASAVAVARSMGVEAPWGAKPAHAMRAVTGTPDGTPAEGPAHSLETAA